MAKAKAKKAVPEFPDKIFITIEHDGKDSYLNTYEALNELPEDQVIATYELVATSKLIVTRKLSS